ncbi:MAG: hypothetical protein GKR95_10530 [Gammaproteobacteria bacterium]|nr:hypothetical protein [Gammaproteobacteria bacterium]
MLQLTVSDAVSVEVFPPELFPQAVGIRRFTAFRDYFSSYQSENTPL